ncbi:hypothetical protein [Streptomyces cucumeris]|uniref:hypothetical protein n=1 Tax=Streptomyces cucumeris TaxID=2962890 RepID=UPI0020C88BF7|nr:hypothetical protein [Streptomyces sp. NEAU-Y11]MCP9210490.1 hypothetical protein [Streptomyces sp. NEAU-Y11]
MPPTRYILFLALVPGMLGLAFGGDGSLLAVVAQVRWVSRGAFHPAGPMVFHCASEPGATAGYLPELQHLATTADTWWPEISESSTNRVIETTARDAYSFRNPGNQCLRTRCATARRAREHLDVR